MIKLFADSFKTTNNCIILATPLILFLTLLGLYTSYAGYAADDPYKLFISMVTFLIMFCGFLSAWLYMVKKTLQMSKNVYVFDNDRTKSLIELLGMLPKGIGRLMLPITAAVGIYIILCLILFSVVAYIVTVYNNLSEYWSYFWISGIIFLMFITMLWIPEIIYAKKNPVISLYYSFIKLILNFKDCVILYLYNMLLLGLIAYLYQSVVLHPIITFFLLIFFYYILVYIVVLLFTYYEQKFIKE